ncbi:hypothetical protein JTE90_026576 [Oedothorax gibbosus]|uniref:Uncharacterized protein n=1 Tax=Oedothorax gibbosus TaxID=931172 RepID=A0AAV6U116_9ARAC|nr:hypothetical protein JTE90_026576 [Oedothorax gibbosus]
MSRGDVAAFAIGATVFLAAPSALLNAAGFTKDGVKANSGAANAHSCIGDVRSGSPFAILQSLAVLGFTFGPKIVLGATGGYVGVRIKRKLFC